MTSHEIGFFLFVTSMVAAGCATDARPDDPAYSQSGDGKADSTWSHLTFQSVEGTSIRVDYQIASSTQGSGALYVQTATPLWINVQRDDLDSANGVHVWIGDQSYASKLGYDESAQYFDLHDGPDHNIDLYRSEDPTRFTGQLADGLEASNYTEGDDEAWYDAYQFAIVIDDQWQTDPISGTHNFLAKSLFSYNNQ